MGICRKWEKLKSEGVADLTDAYFALANPKRKLALAEKQSTILTGPEIGAAPPEKKSFFLWDGKVYPIHPICDLFPCMNEEDQASLRDDVAANGLLEPILLYQGQVLDGKLRFQACLDAGVEPRFREYDGDNPLELACGRNVTRKHLTPEDRKTAMEKVAPFESKARGFWPDEE
jgi:hypothetical protein